MTTAKYNAIPVSYSGHDYRQQIKIANLKKNRGKSKSRYFPRRDDFNAFYEQRLHCVFSVHAIHTAHDNFIIVTHTLHSSAKNILSCAVVIRDCFYLQPLSQLRFLFTNELSNSAIAVLCSDQKFINVSHKKSTLKSRS